MVAMYAGHGASVDPIGRSVADFICIWHSGVHCQLALPVRDLMLAQAPTMRNSNFYWVLNDVETDAARDVLAAGARTSSEGHVAVLGFELLPLQNFVDSVLCCVLMQVRVPRLLLLCHSVIERVLQSPMVHVSSIASAAFLLGYLLCCCLACTHLLHSSVLLL